MKNASEIGLALEAARIAKRISKLKLAERTGLTPKTVAAVLDGGDSKISTIIALAYELQLEITLVPGLVAKTLEARAEGQELRPLVQSFVRATLSGVRINDKE